MSNKLSKALVNSQSTYPNSKHVIATVWSAPCSQATALCSYLRRWCSHALGVTFAVVVTSSFVANIVWTNGERYDLIVSEKQKPVQLRKTDPSAHLIHADQVSILS